MKNPGNEPPKLRDNWPTILALILTITIATTINNSTKTYRTLKIPAKMPPEHLPKLKNSMATITRSPGKKNSRDRKNKKNSIKKSKAEEALKPILVKKLTPAQNTPTVPCGNHGGHGIGIGGRSDRGCDRGCGRVGRIITQNPFSPTTPSNTTAAKKHTSPKPYSLPSPTSSVESMMSDGFIKKNHRSLKKKETKRAACLPLLLTA